MSGQWDSLPREQFGCVGGDFYWDKYLYLSDPGKPGVRSLGPDVCPSVRQTPSADLTDVTLADDDTNSILTDNANRAIQGSVKMYVMQPSGN